MIDGFDRSEVDILCAVAEVTSGRGSAVLASTNIYASRLLKGETEIHLPFSLPQRTELEFRVRSTGRLPLKIGMDRPVTLIPHGRDIYSPVLTLEKNPTDRFFLQNFGHLRGMYENGASIRVTDNGTVATVAGASFYMRSVEDFQIVNEVFFGNGYNISTSREMVVIDVGMNVGLTSLYMAKSPNVVEVHSFEPFRAPFLRAIENFLLNPVIAQKIRPSAFGLSGKRETLVVNSMQDATIGTSIRGLGAGSPEQIEIHDAADSLRTIIAVAAERNLDVAIKLDCEGSEFAALESLDDAGLLQHVKVLLIEWHKWWSAKLTHRDIHARLFRNGFIAFDHTRAADLWAGQIYAVRV